LKAKALAGKKRSTKRLKKLEKRRKAKKSRLRKDPRFRQISSDERERKKGEIFLPNFYFLFHHS
jgi:hypothetical protein